jgi:N6-adenosine-specific RNA methylase IME4
VTRYRTIVADPPWEIADFPAWTRRGPDLPPPYAMMSLAEIKKLPVADLAEADRWHVNGDRGGCNLFLWTTTQYLVPAHEVCEAWRFKPTAVLVWCKPPLEGGLGGTFKANVEFVVVARRGSPPRATGASGTRWFQWPRGKHSEKPEAFLDLVETVSPGPYLEMFARRARFGWDYWGDESLGTAEMVA